MSARVHRVLAVGVLLLAGCATPGPVVESRGAWPAAAATFRISSFAADPDGPRPPVEEMVARGLQDRGLRLAGPGQAADYAVQVTFADAPSQVGAFTPQPAGDPAWLRKGQKRRPWTLNKGGYVLGLSIADTASGQEAYAARVTRPYRKPSPDDVTVLVEAALGQ